MSEHSSTDILDLTAQIVSAHVAHNSVQDLPALIQSVYRSLSSAGQSAAAPVEAPPTPAVPIKKSVFPDHIVCLEDGKKLKMLKRHLQTSFGMTPEQYREKWKLPSDYPMVAPNYASKRSDLAKAIGLGRKPPEQTDPAAETAAAAEPVVTKAPARRARGTKG